MRPLRRSSRRARAKIAKYRAAAYESDVAGDERADKAEAEVAVLRLALREVQEKIIARTPGIMLAGLAITEKALDSDAGKLAAEMLRAADEWEREETRLIAEQKAGEDCDTSKCGALSDALAAAVRARPARWEAK